MSDDTYESYGVADIFCEGLARIERIGSCRRLVFVVSDRSNPSQRGVVAKLVFPAEVIADLAQMIATDRPEPGAAFAHMSIDAVKH
jgi:hypothetical protein